MNEATCELRLHAVRKTFSPVWAVHGARTVTMTDEMREANDETPLILDTHGVPRASVLGLLREAVREIRGDAMKLIHDKIKEHGNTIVNINAMFSEPRFVRFVEGTVQLAGYQAEVEMTLKPVPIIPSFNVYKDITIAETRAESASLTLADGTVVAMIRDPATNQMLITASPPKGQENVNIQFVLVGDDQHGNTVIGTGSLVSEASSSPPRIVIPRTKQ